MPVVFVMAVITALAISSAMETEELTEVAAAPPPEVVKKAKVKKLRSRV